MTHRCLQVTEDLGTQIPETCGHKCSDETLLFLLFAAVSTSDATGWTRAVASLQGPGFAPDSASVW